MLKPINPLLNFFLFVVGQGAIHSALSDGDQKPLGYQEVGFSSVPFSRSGSVFGMAWSKPTSIVDGLEQASMPPTDMIDYDNYDMDWTVVQPIVLTRLPPRTPKTWGLFTRVSLARTKISI